MQFDEKGFMTGKTMMLLPGTACDYQTNFGSVLDALEDKYHVICVNYDGFDGSSLIFPDMFTVSGGELRAEVSADYFRCKCLYDRTFGSVNAHY